MLANRKRKHIRSRHVVTLTVAVFLFGQRLLAGPREDFDGLEKEMERAQEAFINALDVWERKVAQARAKGAEGPPTSDLFQPPRDPRPDVLRKMDALAETAGNTADGAYVAIRTFQWSVDVDAESAFQRFEKLSRRFPDDPALTEILPFVGDLAPMSGSAEGWLGALDQLRRVTKHKENEFGALFSMGRIQMDGQKLPQAKKSFEEVMKLAGADSEAGRAARGFIYEIDHLQVGMPAPPFTTKTLDGKEISLQSLRGKVVLLDFWATWCAGCITEIPRLQSAKAKLTGRPFEILSISVDAERETLDFFLKTRPMPGILTWDEKGEDNPVAELYNVHGLPTWYLIDAEGIIRARDPDSDRLAETVIELLEPKRTEPANPTRKDD